MTGEEKGNDNDGGILQEALKTGRAFGGRWRKWDNELSLCLGIVGKQQFAYLKVNVLLLIHTKNTSPSFETVLEPLAVTTLCKIASLSSLCYVDTLCDCFSNYKIESQKLVSASDYLFLLQV